MTDREAILKLAEAVCLLVDGEETLAREAASEAYEARAERDELRERLRAYEHLDAKNSGEVL